LSPQQAWPQVLTGCSTIQQHWHAERKTEREVKFSKQIKSHEGDVNLPTAEEHDRLTKQASLESFTQGKEQLSSWLTQ
jgi:dsDNA-binding SOS-regulon protein